MKKLYLTATNAVDLRENPIIGVFGSTGSGKSNWINNAILQGAIQHKEDLEIIYWNDCGRCDPSTKLFEGLATNVFIPKYEDDDLQFGLNQHPRKPTIQKLLFVLEFHNVEDFERYKSSIEDLVRRDAVFILIAPILLRMDFSMYVDLCRKDNDFFYKVTNPGVFYRRKSMSFSFLPSEKIERFFIED